jgi:hypothetical protein
MPVSLIKTHKICTLNNEYGCGREATTRVTFSTNDGPRDESVCSAHLADMRTWRDLGDGEVVGVRDWQERPV